MLGRPKLGVPPAPLCPKPPPLRARLTFRDWLLSRRATPRNAYLAGLAYGVVGLAFNLALAIPVLAVGAALEPRGRALSWSSFDFWEWAILWVVCFMSFAFGEWVHEQALPRWLGVPDHQHRLAEEVRARNGRRAPSLEVRAADLVASAEAHRKRLVSAFDAGAALGVFWPVSAGFGGMLVLQAFNLDRPIAGDPIVIAALLGPPLLAVLCWAAARAIRALRQIRVRWPFRGSPLELLAGPLLWAAGWALTVLGSVRPSRRAGLPGRLRRT